MQNKLHIYEVNRPWWYRMFRSISMFCFRYWWLVLLLFILYVILWYFICFATPYKSCDTGPLHKNIESINQRLDSCCDCSSIARQAPPLPANIKPCDYDASMSGQEGYTATNHQLGPDPGMVFISYDMLNLPDQMDVYYDDQLVASTDNLVSNTGSLSFYYPAEQGKPTYCKVVLKAPMNGTAWSYHIGCPR